MPDRTAAYFNGSNLKRDPISNSWNTVRRLYGLEAAHFRCFDWIPNSSTSSE